MLYVNTYNTQCILIVCIDDFFLLLPDWFPSQDKSRVSLPICWGKTRGIPTFFFKSTPSVMVL